MKDPDGRPDRRRGRDIDVAESRRLTRALAARRALSARLTPGPRRKLGTRRDRSAHLTDRHD